MAMCACEHAKLDKQSERAILHASEADIFTIIYNSFLPSHFLIKSSLLLLRLCIVLVLPSYPGLLLLSEERSLERGVSPSEILTVYQDHIKHPRSILSGPFNKDPFSTSNS